MEFKAWWKQYVPKERIDMLEKTAQAAFNAGIARATEINSKKIDRVERLQADLRELVFDLRATGHKSGEARCATMDEHTRAMTEQQTLYYAADKIEAILRGER